MTKRRLAVAIALLVLPAAVAAGEEKHAEVPWIDSPRTAFDTAKKEGKPVLVDIWATWCAPCKLMDQTTYRDADVIDASAAFVPLKVDADLHKTFIERYRIEAYPTVLFLDQRGREISRLLGHITTDKLISSLRFVSAGYAGYLDAVDDKRNAAAQVALGRFLLGAGNPAEAGDLLKKALRKGDGELDGALRDEMRLTLARCASAEGEVDDAIDAFEELAAGAATRELQAKALWSLSRAEAARGNEEAAAAAETRLRDEFGDLEAVIRTP